MPHIIHRHIRFQVIDRCLRDTRREYHIRDILDECNRTMQETYGTVISLRTIQYDISILRKAPFNIELDEELLKHGVYRYFDTGCTRKAFLMLDGGE